MTRRALCIGLFSRPEKFRCPADRFYHGVLRFSGALAFVCEFAFQIIAFGIATWGLAVAVPNADLFINPETLTIKEAILFWCDVVFGMVDGPHVFGMQFSTLEANQGTWPFGLTVISFKLFVIGMVIRLFQLSLNLQPRDISRAWGAALEKG